MNLAIEYLTRTKLSQQLLKTPCSLFLNNVFDKNPLVVTIQNCYGKPQEVVVKHWQLGKVAPDRVLPPVEEFVVNREDMFTSPFVVLDDYNIMDYAVSPYPVQAKQSADEPYATTQEKRYHECLDSFFCTPANECKRRNWLWKSFVNSFFPDTMKSDFGSLTAEHQRDAVQNLCPLPWKGWCMWLTHMLCDTQSPVAAELAFGPIYRERLKTNELYQQMIKPLPKATAKTKRVDLSNSWVALSHAATGGWTTLTYS
jgi:hypothetical protein